jgi:ribosomal protein S18 acetylase RimI-like enzyme
MADFRFTNEHRASEVGNVIGALERPRLWVPANDYPDYYEWLQKTEQQIGSGQKRAMLAYSGLEPVGTIIYQRHECRPGCVEIRNISVDPSVRGRYVGSFLLRNTEAEAVQRDFVDCQEMVIDTKVANSDMIAFLLKHGYKLAEVTDLYGLSAGEDAVFTKSLAA